MFLRAIVLAGALLLQSGVAIAADATETVAAWCMAIAHRDGPVAMVLSRQELPILDPAQYQNLADGVRMGGYVLTDRSAGKPELVLVATGSEVHLALAAWEQLSMQAAKVRVVSVPCVEVFSRQPQTYRDTVLPRGVAKLVIEAGVTLGWRSYFESGDAYVGVERFGASAPGEVVMREYGFTVENICQHAERMLKNQG